MAPTELQTTREMLRAITDKQDKLLTEVAEIKVHNVYTKEKLKLVDKHEDAYKVFSVGKWIFGGLSITEVAHLLGEWWKK